MKSRTQPRCLSNGLTAATSITTAVDDDELTTSTTRTDNDKNVVHVRELEKHQQRDRLTSSQRLWRWAHNPRIPSWDCVRTATATTGILGVKRKGRIGTRRLNISITNVWRRH